MSVLLVGDATDNYSGDSTSTGAGSAGTGYMDGFQYTALLSGTVTDLQLRTASTAPTCTTLYLGIYADVAGAPGALLGSGSTTTLAGDAWLSVTGLSVPVVAGSAYWLVMFPEGGNLWFNTAHSYSTGGGTAERYRTSTNTALQDPFPSTFIGSSNAGPIGFQALGTATPTTPPLDVPLDLRFTLCDLDGNPLDHLDAIGDQDGATITINDASTGTVTVSLDADLAVAPKEMRHVIRVTYGSALAVNGIVGSWRANGASGRCTIPFRDSVQRLERRNFRFGHASVDTGYARDGAGVRSMIADVEPTLAHGTGIITDGPVDTTTTSTDISHATRSDPVMERIKDLTTALGGIDVAFVPVDEDHPPTARAWAPGDLCEVQTFAFQGSDRTDPTVDTFLSFDYGAGAPNLQDFTFGPNAEELANYAVAVANGGEINADDTTYRKLSSVATWVDDGLYEKWEGVDVGDRATGESLADYETRVQSILLARAAWLVQQYGTAPLVIELVLPSDRGDIPAWGRDYQIGDRVHVVLRRGWINYEGNVRIVSVQLSRDGNAGGTRQTLQVIPVGTGTPTDTGD